MKRLLFWRICFILMHKLEFNDHIAARAGAGGVSWIPSKRMRELWNQYQGELMNAGGRIVFPEKLYKRLKKSRMDICVSAIYRARPATEPRQPTRDPALVAIDTAYDTSELLERGFKVRVWNQGGNAYIVGVKGEIANLWR